MSKTKSKEKYIDIIGARENNLKDIDVRIPKNKLVAKQDHSLATTI